EQCAWVYIASSQMQTLCQWLGALPETLFLAHPSLCVMHAIALMYTNHLETAAARLRAVERGGVLGEHTPGRGLLGQKVACRGDSTRRPLPMKRPCNWSHDQRPSRSWPKALPTASVWALCCASGMSWKQPKTTWRREWICSGEHAQSTPTKCGWATRPWLASR